MPLLSFLSSGAVKITWIEPNSWEAWSSWQQSGPSLQSNPGSRLEICQKKNNDDSKNNWLPQWRRQKFEIGDRRSIMVDLEVEAMWASVHVYIRSKGCELCSLSLSIIFYLTSFCFVSKCAAVVALSSPVRPQGSPFESEVEQFVCSWVVTVAGCSVGCRWAVVVFVDRGEEKNCYGTLTGVQLELSRYP